MKPDIDLYLVSTPRQWWIACALASQLQRNSILLIDNCFNGSDVYAEVTTHWQDSPFMSIEVLSGKNEWLNLDGFSRVLKKTLEPKIRKQQIKKLLAENTVSNFFTSSVRDWLTQFAVHTQSGMQVSYLDDGIRTYQVDRPKRLSFIAYLHKKLIHGRWYCAPQSYADTTYLKSAYVFHAQMVNSDIKNLQVIELKNDWFVSQGMLNLAQSLLKIYDFEGFVSQQNGRSNCILAFTKLSILERDCPSFNLGKFKARVLKTVRKAQENGQVIWVKYHPREVCKDIYDISKMVPNVQFIPASIPFDILISLLVEGDSMLGEISTVLFDVALRRPDIDVFSVDCLLQNPVLATPFQKVGVKILECE